MALPHPLNMTVEEYFAFDERSADVRYEYIDGRIHKLVSETPDHSQISANIGGLLYNALRGRRCRLFNLDVYVRLSDTRYVHSDVVVSCDERDRRQEKTISYPHLVVEVISPESYYYDRHRKFRYYQTCTGVQEYVLVSSHHLWIEVFRRRQTQDKSWFYSAFLNYGDEIEFASLDIRFPIEDVYRDVDVALVP